MGAQRALGSRHRAPAELDVIITSLVDKLARRLRGADRVCRTVTLRLRFQDYTRATRSHSMPAPTAHTATILTVARLLLTTALPLIAERGLTLIGASLSNLDSDDAVQLTLPFDDMNPPILDSALDAVRDKFGSRSITRAGLLGHDPGIEMPMLPD
jgi:DNA polymerase-4